MRELDSYPFGFLSSRSEKTPERKARFLRQGDPDNQPFTMTFTAVWRMGRANSRPAPF